MLTPPPDSSHQKKSVDFDDDLYKSVELKVYNCKYVDFPLNKCWMRELLGSLPPVLVNQPSIDGNPESERVDCVPVDLIEIGRGDHLKYPGHQTILLRFPIEAYIDRKVTYRDMVALLKELQKKDLDAVWSPIDTDAGHEDRSLWLRALYLPKKGSPKIKEQDAHNFVYGLMNDFGHGMDRSCQGDPMNQDSIRRNGVPSHMVVPPTPKCAEFLVVRAPFDFGEFEVQFRYHDHNLRPHSFATLAFEANPRRSYLDLIEGITDKIAAEFNLSHAHNKGHFSGFRTDMDGRFVVFDSSNPEIGKFATTRTIVDKQPEFVYSLNGNKLRPRGPVKLGETSKSHPSDLESQCRDLQHELHATKQQVSGLEKRLTSLEATQKASIAGPPRVPFPIPVDPRPGAAARRAASLGSHANPSHRPETVGTGALTGVPTSEAISAAGSKRVRVEEEAESEHSKKHSPRRDVDLTITEVPGQQELSDGPASTETPTVMQSPHGFPAFMDDTEVVSLTGPTRQHGNAPVDTSAVLTLTDPGLDKSVSVPIFGKPTPMRRALERPNIPDSDLIVSVPATAQTADSTSEPLASSMLQSTSPQASPSLDHSRAISPSMSAPRAASRSRSLHLDVEVVGSVGPSSGQPNNTFVPVVPVESPVAAEPRPTLDLQDRDSSPDFCIIDTPPLAKRARQTPAARARTPWEL